MEGSPNAAVLDAPPRPSGDPADGPFFLLLASLGARVLRPGGRVATERMLADVAIDERDDVVELGPGLGWTAARIAARRPASYVGVEVNARFAPAVTRATAAIGGRCVVAPAQESGLANACADVVVGEAMLGMQDDAGRLRALEEARRLLRPQGRYAIHELALRSDAAARRDEVEATVSQALRARVRPPTEEQWRDLLEQAGFEVVSQASYPWRPASFRRLVANEGLANALRIGMRALRRPAAVRRLRELRRATALHHDALAVLVVVARSRP